MQLAGHEAVRIIVRDMDLAKPKNDFVIYLDDGYVGGEDHVFVDAELNTKLPTKTEVIDPQLQQNISLEEMSLKPPIGPGVRTKPGPGSGVPGGNYPTPPPWKYPIPGVAPYGR
jgi:hypothetical protein